MKLAILDRDGTLNALGDGFIASAADWTPLPGALEAVARLNHGGWHVVLAYVVGYAVMLVLLGFHGHAIRGGVGP